MKFHYERVPLRRYAKRYQEGGEVYDPLAASAGVAPAGTPRIDQIDWGQPSWTQQALEQSQKDQEAYAREGVRGMLRDTEGTQDLAGGFSDAGFLGRVRAYQAPRGARAAMTAAEKVAPEVVPFRAAPFARYAHEYPPVGPPQLMSKETAQPYPLPKGKQAWSVDDPTAQKLVESNKAYWSKQLTPEAEEFAKARTAIQREMEEKGYTPYFDPAQRSPVNPADYPTNQDMATQALPAKPATIEKYRAMYDTPEARERLQRAYDVGKTVPGAEHWYDMKQLHDAYVKELGDVEGKARFKRDFAEAMAATTGGATPTANLLMAHLANYMRNKGVNPFPPSHQLPYPVGGRYAGSNMKMYENTVANPDFSGFDVENPKRFDFTYSFLGNPTSATIDEQMSDIIKPGMQKPEGKSYGVASQLVREMAERNGIDPQNFQDVAWAGHKKMTTEAGGKTFDYEGPMIQHVNAAIERTHRLTGMPREEIVRRGLVRGEVPLYGAAATAGVGAAANQQDDHGMARGGAAQADDGALTDEDRAAIGHAWRD